MATYSFTVEDPPDYDLGLSFEVSRIDNVLIPRQRNIWNEFDELGAILSLKRNKGEKNWEFRRRIFDGLVNKANSSYQGLVNGVTRELGLSLYDCLSIVPKENSDGSFLAADPCVRFEGAYVYLYSDYTNGTLAHKIDRYEPGGNYEHLYRLVDFINTTIYFEAHLVPGIDRNTRSMVLFNQSNRKTIDVEDIPASTKFRLVKPQVVKGSVFFSDREVFRTEVLTEAEIGSPGEYYIDYITGIVVCQQVPSSGTWVRYKHTETPFVAKASPVIFYNINEDSFREKMFEQILQDDGTYEHGLPTKLGTDMINELLSVVPMYYGI
jgi:hypothetical protein